MNRLEKMRRLLELRKEGFDKQNRIIIVEQECEELIDNDALIDDTEDTE